VLILVNGKKRAGKDYLTKLLVDRFNERVSANTATSMSIADSLKNIIAQTFNISLEELDVLKNSEETFRFGDREISFRRILQNFGTESMKLVFGDDVWIELLMNKYNKYITNTGDIVIVPDFRFECEYEYIKDSITINIFNTELSTDDHQRTG